MPRPKKDKPRHSSGMYEYKATIGHTIDGKAIRKSFYSKTSKAAAKAKAEEYIVNSKVAEQTGEQFVSGKISFEAWAKKWLETYKKPNVKPHTYKWTYETNVINYFIPYFNKASIIAIRQTDIQEYFNKHTDLSITTLKRQKTILYDIFDTAIDNDYCSKNPVKHIVIKSTKAEFEKKWYNREQAEMLSLKALSDKTKYANVVYLILNLGLRRGEILGLKWSDIDFDNKILHVRRAIEPDTTGMPQDGEVKSKSSLREIPLNDNQTLFFKSLDKQSEFVLAGKTKFGYTSIYGFDKGYKLYMEKVTKELNLPYLTPHELRHTYGTVLREKGLDLYSIARLMGHSDTKVTEKHYIGNDIEVLRNRLKSLDI